MLSKLFRLGLIIILLLLAKHTTVLALDSRYTPITDGDVTLENTSIVTPSSQGSINVFEQTMRINVWQKLDDQFFLAARLKLYNINQKEYRNDDQELFDRYHLGYRNKDTEVLVGKQWLWLGQGLLADINLVGGSIRTKFANKKGTIMAFYTNEVQAIDSKVAWGNGLEMGTTYKRSLNRLQNFDHFYDYNRWVDSTNSRPDSRYPFNQGYIYESGQAGFYNVYLPTNSLKNYSPNFYSDTNFRASREITLGFNIRQLFKNKISLEAEYIHNITQRADGYLLKLSKGFYALSWRNMQPNAIDPTYSVNYHFADSRGWRIRADYPVFRHAIFTIYYDRSTTTNKPLNSDKNIFYTGFAYYF